MLRPPEKTPHGFLRVDGYVGRAGVYEYRNDDGSIRRELRPEEEVFSPQALAGFEGAPLTDGHPSKPVTASNARTVEVGTVTGPASRADNHVAASMVFKDPATIRKIESGKRQLSPGYSIDLEETPGIHPVFGRYDAIQRNIVINHVALVDQARGGNSVCLRMDGVDDLRVDDLSAEVRNNDAAPRRGVIMDPEEQIRSLKTQLADLEKAAQQHQAAAAAATTRADRADAAIEPLKARIEELEGQIAAGATAVETDAIARERLRADEAETAIRRFDERLSTEVRTRCSLMRRAAAVMGENFRMDDLTERQIHAAVVKRLDPNADTKNVTDAFLAGKFDTLVELHGKTARNLAHVSSTIVDQTVRNDEVAQREQRTRDFRDQWKKPLPNDIRARKDV